MNAEDWLAIGAIVVIICCLGVAAITFFRSSDGEWK